MLSTLLLLLNLCQPRLFSNFRIISFCLRSLHVRVEACALQTHGSLTVDLRHQVARPRGEELLLVDLTIYEPKISQVRFYSTACHAFRYFGHPKLDGNSYMKLTRPY